jgi:hypothetical protein
MVHKTQEETKGMKEEKEHKGGVSIVQPKFHSYL